MENQVTRSFFGFSIFIFFLYFMKVSTGPTIPAKHSIIEEMNIDQQLCRIPKFLYENNVTESCHNVTYPDGISKSQCDLECTNTLFLCLAFYDTMYKVCQSNQSQTIFNNVSTFYSYIEKSSPGEKEIDHVIFCKNIKDVQFSYQKLKPLLSSLIQFDYYVCYLTCFGEKAKFVPLCAILVWSKSIDDMQQVSKNLQTVSENNISDEPIATGSRQNTQEQNSNPTVSETPSALLEGSVNNASEIKTSLNKPIDIIDNGPVLQEAAKSKPKNSAEKSGQSTVNNINSSVPKKEDTLDNLEMPQLINRKSDNLDKSENSNTNNANNAAVENINDGNESVESSTLSENTQDHENTVNLDEWNHAEDDKLSNDPDDIPVESIDTADQSQGIPKPSEQRDIISHYHSIRTDEESHFFTYFTAVSLISIAAYIGYHNKQKIFAIVLEGRRTRNSRGRRRPSTVNYRKLDCTLEEAVTSQCNANVTHTHVIY